MARKTFKDSIENPAELFISKPSERAKGKKPADPPDGYKINPLYLETRSKRLQLLIQPSLIEKIRAKAQREGRSVNDVVHTILEEAFEGEE